LGEPLVPPTSPLLLHSARNEGLGRSSHEGRREPALVVPAEPDDVSEHIVVHVSQESLR